MTQPTAMAVDIGRLRVTRQPARFLDVAPEIPDVKDLERVFGTGARWLSLTKTSGLTRGDANCAPSNWTLAPRGCLNDGGIGQVPFSIGDALQMSALNWTAIGDANEEMSDRFDQWLSAAFAQELITGAGSTGTSLSNTASAPTTLGGLAFGSAAITIARALAVLEAEFALRAGNAVGFIHLPPGALGLAVTNYSLRFVDGHWETPLGNVVIADAGYVDALEPTGQAASGALSDWIYISGPVFYKATGPAFAGDNTGDFNPSTNLLTRWLKAQGILVFDPAYVSAVLAAY